VVAQNKASLLRVVDVDELAVTATIRIKGGPIGAIVWLEQTRLLAVQEISGERQRLLTIDLAGPRITAGRPFDGSIQAMTRTAHRLVLLLAPAQAVGVARLALADRGGTVRLVRLARMLAGSQASRTG
jgi:hypothetical protein